MRTSPIIVVPVFGALMVFGLARSVVAQDLAVTKTAPATVVAGQNLTYSLSLENKGSTSASSVVLSDPLPPNTTFVSVRQIDGPNAQILKPAVGATGTVSANIFSLPPTTAIGSSPLNFVTAGGVAYFIVQNGGYGSALWKTDGTAAGTILLKNFYDSVNSTRASDLVNVNGTLFFSAQTGSYDRELWKSDGTPEGTVRVKDIFPGTDFASNPRFLTAVNGTLFFTASESVNGIELWKSDGTEGGTVLVKDIQPGTNSSQPANFVNVNGTLFFTAITRESGIELWKSDGTAEGTVLVKDIVSGSSGSSSPSRLTNVNGTLFFTATTSANGEELWKSDGTAEGTVLVKDIASANFSSIPNNLTNVNGILFFSASGDFGGTELWKSDGTPEGTVQVKDIYPGSSSSPAAFGVVGNTLYFSADDGMTGRELWKSDGTAEGTVLVKDLYPGQGANPQSHYSSSPGALSAVNGTLFFSATTSENGTELWKSDGTAEGTVRVKDIFPGTGSSTPGFFTSVNGTTVFSAADNVTGRELWRTDGTEAGTVLVKDIIGLPKFEIVVKVDNAAMGTTLSNTATVRASPSGNDTNPLNDSATAVTAVGEVGSLVVNRADDVTAADGLTTLREAIAYAGSLEGTPTITFDPTVFGSAKTLTLNGTEFLLDHDIIIEGPGARLLTIDAKTQSRIFNIRANSNVTLRGLKITGGKGSGIFNQGNVTINACTLTGNTSTYGGALFNDYTTASKATLLDSTLSNNNTAQGPGSGPDFGGAIFNGGQLVATNCTFSGNSSASGGAIANNAGTTTLSKCTLSGNTTTSTGAVYGRGLTLNNCIVTANMGVDLYTNGVINGDFNLLGAVTGGTLAGTNNQVGVTDPKLGELQDNGGPTDTLALLATSPALNAGDPTFNSPDASYDQRGTGFSRVRDGRLDVGAFEVQNTTPVITSVVLAPVQAQTNDLLTATAAATDTDGDALLYSYLWKKNGQVLPNEAGGTLDLSKIGNGDRGDQISVVVTVSDGHGAITSKESEAITIGGSAPTSVVLGQTSIEENMPNGTTVGTFSTTDADGGTSYIYKLVAGEGSEDNAAFRITDNKLESAISFNFENKNSYSVRVSSTDEDGLAVEAAFTISVSDVNEAPSATVILSPLSPTTNQLLSAKVSGTDAEGSTTTYSYQWKKGGTLLENEVSSTLDLSKIGNGDKGDKVSVLVVPSDGTLTGQTTTATVTVANSAPTLATATFQGRENQVLSSRVVGLDADQEALTFIPATLPRYGKLVLQSNGNFTYAPIANWNGTDSFQVRVRDGSGASATAVMTVKVAPINGLPVAGNDTVKGVEDTPLSIAAVTLLRNDLNGENRGEADALRIVRVAVPSGFPGTLRLDVTKQTITFTPKLNWNGMTTFTYTVQDSGRATATAQVTLQIAPVNDAPVVLPGRFAVLSGTVGEVQLVGSDVEGDALTFALSTRPSNGTAQVIKAGDKWLVRYQSRIGFTGTDTLSVIARDSRLNSAPATITVTVATNNAPQLVSLLPNRGTFPAGSTVVFEQKVRDVNGTANLDAVALLIGNFPTIANARNGATLWFDAVENRFTLTKDDGTATFAPVTLGGTLENSQVKVTLAAGDVMRDKYGYVTLKWRVTFKSSFTGLKSLWGRVEDLGGLNAGFTKAGDITLAVSAKEGITSAPTS